MAKELRDGDGSDGLIGHGTLYKALSRLEKSGLLDSSWEDADAAAEAGRPRRRLYHITSDGRLAAAAASRRGRSPIPLVSGHRAGMTRPGPNLPAASAGSGSGCTRGSCPTTRRSADAQRSNPTCSNTRSRRRAHASATQRLNAEVLARVLVGVPADLSWRRATRQPHPRLALGGIPMSMSKSTSTRLLYVLAGLIVLYAWMGVAAFAVHGTRAGRNQRNQKLFWMGVRRSRRVPLIAGLVIRSKNPRRGLHLIILGAIGPALWFGCSRSTRRS